MAMEEFIGYESVEVVLQQNADCSGKCVSPATCPALKTKKSEKVHGGELLDLGCF
jgi:hypothetical protein